MLLIMEGRNAFPRGTITFMDLQVSTVSYASAEYP